jgi:hypothetical protein
VEIWNKSNHFDNIGLDGKIILKRILNKCYLSHGMYLSASGKGQITSSWEHGQESPEVIKYGEIRD